MKGTDEQTRIRLALWQSVYAGLIVFGFLTIRDTKDWVDFLFLLFAFSLIVNDWLYIHKHYLAEEYKDNWFFVVDLSIVFLFSRMLESSVRGARIYYWLWLFLVFLAYLLWDCWAKKKTLLKKREQTNRWVGDIFGATLFGVALLLLWRGYLPLEWWVLIPTIIVYVLSALAWHRRGPWPYVFARAEKVKSRFGRGKGK